MAKLTRENFSKGFLIDEECMAGVTEEVDPTTKSRIYSAFVMNHVSGEYLGFQRFSEIDAALTQLNSIPRAWVYESTSGCGGERCGEGKCKGEACRLYNGSASGGSACHV